MRRHTPTALVALTLAASTSALAWPSFSNHVPNAEAAGDCDLCHGSGALTAFGTQAGEVQVNGVSWSRLFCQDADDDGQTNGQELGDPCGHWRRGEAPPRTTDLSSPSAAAETATSPDVGCDVDETAPATCDDTEVDDVGDDGCASLGASSSSLTAALVVLLALARRSRRRGASAPHRCVRRSSEA